VSAQSPLQAQLAQVLALVAKAAGESAKPKPVAAPDEASPADELAATFSLSAFERDVILLAALPAVEPGAADLIARAQGDARRQLPTVAFALSTLPDGYWSAFAADGKLRAAGLIELGDEPASSARAVILPERMLHHLMGVDSPDALLLPTARRLSGGNLLAASQRVAAKALGQKIADASADLAAPLFQLVGTDRAMAAHFAAVAAEAAGRTAYLVDSENLPLAPERFRLSRVWSLEARIGKALMVLDAHDASSPQELRAAIRFAANIAGPVVLLTLDPAPVPHRSSERVEVPRPSAVEQGERWRRALGRLSEPLDGAITEVGRHFSASPDVIDHAAEAVVKLGTTGPKAKRPTPEALGKALWEETRSRTRPKLDELAQRLDVTMGWDDIILPARQLETLKAIAAQVRQRVQVYETWGFGGIGRRGLGISALFAGPSGTGKTLSAEVIGGALQLDVYRIDLSAVVSKWIGETEKNLRRVFDAAEDTSAVLLFDEADALFGKRSEVKESHDRYANIEVSYLLQRMETYRGLAILTTNLRSHIDTAFLRRLRFVVDFPFPGDVERQEIWRLAFPADAPTEVLDYARLAQLNVPGGSIKNIALNAAFIAAEARSPIRMIHVRTAARAEYDKLGKPLTDGELRGWTLEVVRG